MDAQFKKMSEDLINTFFDLLYISAAILFIGTKIVNTIAKKIKNNDVDYEKLKIDLQKNYQKEGLTQTVLDKFIQNNPSRAMLYALEIVKDRNETLEKIISQNPEIKKTYEKALEKLPIKKAFDTLKNNNKISPEDKNENEIIVSKNADFSFVYATDVLKKPFEKGKEILKNSAYNEKYNAFCENPKKWIKEIPIKIAFNELKNNKSKLSENGLWKNEKTISKNAEYSFKYATECLKKPFPKGAIAIGKDKILAKKYLSFCANPIDWIKQKKIIINEKEMKGNIVL